MVPPCASQFLNLFINHKPEGAWSYTNFASHEMVGSSPYCSSDDDDDANADADSINGPRRIEDCFCWRNLHLVESKILMVKSSFLILKSPFLLVKIQFFWSNLLYLPGKPHFFIMNNSNFLSLNMRFLDVPSGNLT